MPIGLSAECGSVFSFLCLLLRSVFLLNAAVFVDLALYLAVCGLASVELSCSRASGTSGTVSSAACPWSKPRSLSLSLKLAGSRSATYNLAAALLSARGQHSLTWRRSCCLLEVGHRYVVDLAASHRLGHLCFILFSSFSLRHHLDKKFPGCLHIIWDNSRVELERQIRFFFALQSHTPRATERQCLHPKVVPYSCW